MGEAAEMSTSTTTGTATGSSRPRAGGRPTRALIAVVATLEAVAALTGALVLMTGFVSLDAELTDRLPWGSPPLAGLALALLVAVPNHVLSSLAVRGDRRTGPVAVVVGAMLVGWTLLALALLREPDYVLPLFGGFGLVLVGLGLHLRRTPRPVARAPVPVPGDFRPCLAPDQEVIVGDAAPAPSSAG